ncbi:prolyl oligopeptidase family serine peptidase [Calycomorphotria hydatis]|uniref:Prolyl oligopeptidase family protein n=1 Tax=Calycomorphotria hydatis TaxID=2528027 RepID=A0A517TB69_9PLAN|nr:prolyl oligopeptidase family serine peptidase [Calycomorphotria hydatis]QDT65617.1 Prolyl oligopeptidase family protein [Calycomorphotria hydatis]
MRTLLLFTIFVSLASPVTFADGPKDNIPTNVRQIPPPGITVPEKEQAALEQQLAVLTDRLTSLSESKDSRTRGLIPDVEIFARAVRVALQHNEFFSPKEIQSAAHLLQTGIQRADHLLKGEAPWTTQTGLVVRGFRSRLDQTVQPYGLVIPESYTFTGKDNFRLDLWFHGRGEKLSENAFIAQRMRQVGKVQPKDTIVLHPYGRYSNAFKFAGEIDVLEALEHAKQHYRIDDDRVAVRGFSMGGAGCWQMAVHYPDLFFAANPGAGFSETPEFLKFFQQESLSPTSYERTLWRWYDCPGYAANLYNLPTIAYSGELDIQKQAADIMEAALAKEEISLVHLIGPQTKHSIHSDSLNDIEARLANLAKFGRDQLPHHVQLATYTLRYNQNHWVKITGLRQHWEQARVDATIDGPNRINVETKNVSGLSLEMKSGSCPFDLSKPVTVVVNGKTYTASRPMSDRSWNFHLWQGNTVATAGPPEDGLYKLHGLQGPIDDAFMDSFIVVRPTGEAHHELVDRWSRSEMEHLIKHWRRHFRGDAIVKNDTDITVEDIESSNLILFGDTASNKLIDQISDQLPIKWSSNSIAADGQKFSAAHHAPALIYPNPLNPKRYIVLNSGFTYREFAYLNNARQVPKLPDWAVIDLRTLADSLWPGKVSAAGFFDERWEFNTSQ